MFCYFEIRRSKQVFHIAVSCVVISVRGDHEAPDTLWYGGGRRVGMWASIKRGKDTATLISPFSPLGGGN